MVNRADLKLLAFGHKGSNPLWSNFMTGDFGKAELLKNKYIFVWKFWFFWNGCRKAADSLRQKKGWFFHRFLVEIFLHKLDSHISHILCVDFFADTATLEYLHRCPIVTLVSKYLRRGVSHIIWRQQQGWNWPESPVCPKIESFLQFWSEIERFSCKRLMLVTWEMQVLMVYRGFVQYHWTRICELSLLN